MVTGSRFGGFEFEFIGTLAGQPVNGLTVTSTAPAARTTVTTLTEGSAAQSEIKFITIETPRIAPPDVTSSVTQATPHSTGSGTLDALRFTTPYQSTTEPQAHTGRYDLMIGGTTVTDINFTQSDVTNNRRYKTRSVK